MRAATRRVDPIDEMIRIVGDSVTDLTHQANAPKFQIVAGGPTAGDNAYEDTAHINGPNPMSALIDLSLPVGIRSRHVQIATGLNMHILEAGEPDGRPLILLLHGFPELAYSWRKAMPPLADAGYYVVAPDQRWLWPHDRAGTTGSTVTSNRSRSRGSPLTLSRSSARWA